MSQSQSVFFFLRVWFLELIGPNWKRRRRKLVWVSEKNLARIEGRICIVDVWIAASSWKGILASLVSNFMSLLSFPQLLLFFFLSALASSLSFFTSKMAHLICVKRLLKSNKKKKKCDLELGLVLKTNYYYYYSTELEFRISRDLLKTRLSLY